MAKVRKRAAKKAAKAKKAPRVRKPASEFVELKGTQPKAGITTGCYIRSLIMQDKHTSAEIIELVAKHYPASRCASGDISWNRLQLRRGGGVEVPAPMKRPKKAEAA